MTATLSLKHKVSIVLAMMTCLAALNLSTAPSAEAASRVNYCFRYSTIGVYRNAPTILQRYDGNSWVNVTNSSTDYYGCGAYNITATWLQNNWVRVVAYQPVGGDWRTAPAYHWLGESPYWGRPGTAAYNLGTGTVYCLSGTMRC